MSRLKHWFNSLTLNITDLETNILAHFQHYFKNSPKKYPISVISLQQKWREYIFICSFPLSVEKQESLDFVPKKVVPCQIFLAKSKCSLTGNTFCDHRKTIRVIIINKRFCQKTNQPLLLSSLGENGNTRNLAQRQRSNGKWLKILFRFKDHYSSSALNLTKVVYFCRWENHTLLLLQNSNSLTSEQFLFCCFGFWKTHE